MTSTDAETMGVLGENGHRYPSRYPRGSDPLLDQAWDVMDILAPGEIPDELRFFLAGAVASVIYQAEHDELTEPPDVAAARPFQDNFILAARASEEATAKLRAVLEETLASIVRAKLDG